MQLDTENTLYVGTDVTNGQVHVLIPRQSKLKLVHLRLDDPDPESTDAAEYQLLEKDMVQSTIEL
jgi:hypothetical protein